MISHSFFVGRDPDFTLHKADKLVHRVKLHPCPVLFAGKPPTRLHFITAGKHKDFL
jgi:hypothetical protein